MNTPILRHSAIRGKLMALFMLTSFIALLISSVSFVATDTISYRRAALTDLTTLARITGANSASALNFGDERFASSALSSLAAKPTILAAALYTDEGSVLASYIRSDLADEVVPTRPGVAGHVFRGDLLVLHRPIFEGHEQLGTIYLKLELQLYSRLIRYAGISLVILLGASGVAWLLSSRLQKIVSEPILELAETARIVSTEKNYSVRATKRTQDEIGFLIDQFNDMLTQIEDRTAKLESAIEETSAIDEIARTANSTLDPERVLEAVMVALQKVFPFDGIATALLDASRDHLNLEHRMAMGAGLVAESVGRLRDISIPMSETRSAFTRVVRQARPFFVPRITPEILAGMSPTDRLLYHDFQPQSLLLCPLEVQDGVVGVILFTNSLQTLGLETDDIEAIQRHVTPLATAFQNARLFQDAKIASRAAEEANRIKSEFLAKMSHELRTPLNAIIGYSEMLQEEAREDGNAAAVSDLNKILSSGRHLLELINGVLDLAKIESGKMDVHLEDFDVAALVRGVEGTIQPLVRENANTLLLTGLDELGSMYCDVTKLRQMLFNVLSNASKFTEQGTIRLEAERVTNGEQDWLRFRVRDSGIGMNEEQLGKVFDEFSQADATITKQYGGTGLGLPITKKFCELLGGTITAASEPGQGSTFEILLPARAPGPVTREDERNSEAAGRPAKAARQGALNVLVIDDDPAARDLIGRFLSGEGFSLLTAVDGEEGLRLARERRPDVITLDVVMPRLDGWAVLERLKADADLAAIPVVLLTVSDNRNLGYSLGASEYLTKPIDWERLNSVLAGYERGQGARALVVEDDPNARDMLRRGLERAGWRVTEAENGRVGLELVEEAPPGLILLDLMMPEMDGFEFLALLRQHDAWRSIPVLVVTAKEITAADRTRLEGNVVRILQKGSFSRDDLLREIRNLVGTGNAPTL